MFNIDNCYFKFFTVLSSKVSRLLSIATKITFNVIEFISNFYIESLNSVQIRQQSNIQLICAVDSNKQIDRIQYAEFTVESFKLIECNERLNVFGSNHYKRSSE